MSENRGVVSGRNDRRERRHSNTAKAAELLGYDPQHTTREGVAAFVAWYRENREWDEPLVLAS